MILCLRTDTPSAEVYVCDDDRVIVSRVWEAHRTLARDLLRVCQEVIIEAGVSFSELQGIVVYQGPGSFTGLRIGCTVANTIAYSESVPIVGEGGDSWIANGRARLLTGANDHTVMPNYGVSPRVT